MLLEEKLLKIFFTAIEIWNDYDRFVALLVLYLQVLGTCLRLRLLDKGYLERITGLTLNHQQTDTLKSLADCVYYVLINTKGISLHRLNL